MTSPNVGVMERRRSRRRLFAKSRHAEQSSSNSAWESNDSLLMRTIAIHHNHHRLPSVDDSVVSIDSLNSGLSSITGSHRTGMTGLPSGDDGEESPFQKVFDSEMPSKSQSCPLRPIRQVSVHRMRTLSSESTIDDPMSSSTSRHSSTMRHNHLALGHRRNALIPQRQESISCHLGSSSRSLRDEEACLHQSSHTFAKYTLEREASTRTLDSSFHSMYEDSLMDSSSSIGTLDEGDEDEESATTESDKAKAEMVVVVSQEQEREQEQQRQQQLVDERPSLLVADDHKKSRSLRHMYARRGAGSWTKNGNGYTKSASVRHMTARRKWVEEKLHASSSRHLAVHREENSNAMISETSDETETETSEREPFLMQQHHEEGEGIAQLMKAQMDDYFDDDESIDSQDHAHTRRIRNVVCCKWGCDWLFNTRGKLH